MKEGLVYSLLALGFCVYSVFFEPAPPAWASGWMFLILSTFADVKEKLEKQARDGEDEQ